MYAKKGVFRAGEWQKVKGKGFYYVGMKIVRRVGKVSKVSKDRKDDLQDEIKRIEPGTLRQ